MSNDIWSTDDDSTETLPKGLRDHLKNLEKQLKDARVELEKAQDQNAQLAAARNQATLETLLKDVPKPVAKWLKRDFADEKVEPTKETVEKWLAENGEDFGYKPGEAERPAGEKPPVQDALPPEIQAAYQAIQSFGEGRTENTGAVDGQIEALGGKQDASFDELVKSLRDMGAPLVAYGD